MIISGNSNINKVIYSGYTISKIYACGGSLVWPDTPPTPVGAYRFHVKKTDDTDVYSYCDGAYSGYSHIIQNEVRYTVNGTSSGLGYVGDIAEINFGSCPSVSAIDEVFGAEINNTITAATIENGSINHLATGAFSNLKGLESFIIPDSITSTETGVWANSGLKSVTIGSGLTKLNNDVFANTNLRTVTIPSNITEIGNLVFRGCTALTSVNFENDSVTLIGNGAFKSCTNLRSIDIPSGVSIINDSTFAGCTSLTTFDFKNVNIINRGAFSGCTSLREVNLSGITTLGASSFSGCTSLSGVTFSNSLRTISEGAFYGCTSLSAVTLPSSVTGLSQNAFNYCSSLTSINLSNIEEIGNSAVGNTPISSVNLDNVYTIASYAFQNCNNLTDITIGSNCISIGSNAFYNNAPTSSITLTISATTPPTLSGTIFSYPVRVNAIYVPDASVEDYKSARYWNTYADKIKPISEKP